MSDPTPPQRGRRWTICSNCGNALQASGPGFTHGPYRSCGNPQPITVAPARSLDRLVAQLAGPLSRIEATLLSDAELMKHPAPTGAMLTDVRAARSALASVQEGE